MKWIKNIVLIILVLYGLGMTVFAMLKAEEADKLKLVVADHHEAVENLALEARNAEAEALLAERGAQRQKDIAVEAMTQAERQRDLAMKALENRN